MKNSIKALASVAAVVALTLSAQAAITTSITFNSTTGIAGITTWANLFDDASTANPSIYTSAENNYGGASLFSLAQSWTATTSGTLNRVQIAISGTAPVSFNVSVFNAGIQTGGGGNTDLTDWSNVGDAAGHTYTPGGNVSANLLSDTSVQTWTGFTLGGATAGVLDFSFSGADQIGITAGNQYIFEISATTNPNGMVWLRNPGDPTDYSGGQAFRQRVPLNGNALRDMSLAVDVTPIPEPSSMAFLGIGALLATFVIRRRIG